MRQQLIKEYLYLKKKWRGPLPPLPKIYSKIWIFDIKIKGEGHF